MRYERQSANFIPYIAGGAVNATTGFVRARTIRDTLTDLREAGERGEDRTRLEYWVRRRRRLEVIERAVPAWLDLPAAHPQHRAIDKWTSAEFAVLIGRAVVYPAEPGDYEALQDPRILWDFAGAGLGGNPDRRGRPSRLSTQDQILIYDLWSHGVSTQERLANQFHVSIATVKRIIRKWKPGHNI
jgi:hypothetical protein